MSAISIANAQWRKIYAFLKTHPRVYAGKQEECRQFVDGVHWIMRTGAQWRELPERYGKWNTVYKRFSRWEEVGIWEAPHQEFAQEPDILYLWVLLGYKALYIVGVKFQTIIYRINALMLLRQLTPDKQFG